MVNIHGYFMVNDGFRDNLLGGWPTQPLWKKNMVIQWFIAI